LPAIGAEDAAPAEAEFDDAAVAEPVAAPAAGVAAACIEAAAAALEDAAADEADAEASAASMALVLPPFLTTQASKSAWDTTLTSIGMKAWSLPHSSEHWP
jgi:hypothetical protein